MCVCVGCVCVHTHTQMCILLEYKTQNYMYAWFYGNYIKFKNCKQKRTCLPLLDCLGGYLTLHLHLPVKVTSLWYPLWIKIISLRGCIFLTEGELTLCLIPWSATDLLDTFSIHRSPCLRWVRQSEIPTSKTLVPWKVEAPWALEETSNFEKTKQDMLTESNPRAGASSQERKGGIEKEPGPRDC